MINKHRNNSSIIEVDMNSCVHDLKTPLTFQESQANSSRFSRFQKQNEKFELTFALIDTSHRAHDLIELT